MDKEQFYRDWENNELATDKWYEFTINLLNKNGELESRLQTEVTISSLLRKDIEDFDKDMYTALKEKDAFLSQANMLIAEMNETIKGLKTHKTCKTCKHKLGCDQAQRSKDMFGTKLFEQWFICYEPEIKEVLK